jgi:hypothetical protein
MPTVARRGPVARWLVTVVLLAVTAATLGGCYYVVPAGGPAYPIPPPPYLVGSTYVPARWVWNGTAWVWQPGYWTVVNPPGSSGPPPGAGAPGPPGSGAPSGAPVGPIPPGASPAPPPRQ